MKEQGTPDEQTKISDLATDPSKRRTDPVILHSPHFYALAARALEDRVEVLKKLAKDARAEGYQRQATDYEADAAAIELAMLPQFKLQREFPLVDGEKFEKACSDAIRSIVGEAFKGFDDPKQKFSTDAIERRRERLIRNIGSRVATFARNVADAGYIHGYQVRTTNQDVIAASALEALGGNGMRAD